MTIIVVRHGRTQANASGLLLGRLDVPLDDRGREQATALAEAVGPVDRVISSPLLRTRETAEAFGVPVEIDDRWIEVDYGDIDGTPLSELSSEMWTTWRADIDFIPAGGEALSHVGARVRDALDELASASGGERIVVVSHVSPIKAAVAWAVGGPDELTWRLFVEPASITRIEVGQHGPVLRSFNETAHLASRP